MIRLTLILRGGEANIKASDRIIANLTPEDVACPKCGALIRQACGAFLWSCKPHYERTDALYRERRRLKNSKARRYYYRVLLGRRYHLIDRIALVKSNAMQAGHNTKLLDTLKLSGHEQELIVRRAPGGCFVVVSVRNIQGIEPGYKIINIGFINQIMDEGADVTIL